MICISGKGANIYLSYTMWFYLYSCWCKISFSYFVIALVALVFINTELYEWISAFCAHVAQYFYPFPLLGPTDFEGWSYKLTPVRPSFCSSVCWCDFSVLFSIMALRIFLIFCMSVEDNRFLSSSQMVFLKKVLITDYRDLSGFFTFLSYSPQLPLGST